MTARELSFTANGHDTALPDATMATVATDAFGRLFIPELAFPCRTCGQDLKLQVTGDTVTAATPCPYPDGITTTITLAVPSGTILVTDDLRPLYDWRDKGRHDPPGMASYNSVLGQHQAIAAMAAQGCAYGPVGNTCPRLYRTRDGAYVIASPDYDEDAGQEVVPAGWELLAGIITDLWAYSIADYEDWKAKGGNPDDLGFTETLVEVPPGTYEFTCHTGERSFNDAHGTVIYAGIQYLGDNEDKKGRS
jgi:hypothetical protein